MKHLFLLALLALGSTALQAQPVREYRSGGFGHFFNGPAFFNPRSFNAFLEPQGTLRRVNGTVGGEGVAVRNRALVGVGGLGMVIQKTMTDSVTVDGGLGAGYIKTGYQFLQLRQAFAFFYGGLGGGAMAVRVQNHSSRRTSGLETQAVEPGTEARYDLGLLLVDAGSGVKLIFPDGDPAARSFGGFCMGLDAGCMLVVPMTAWRESNEPVNGMAAPTPTAMPYLRFTVGGAVFKAR